MTAPVAEFAVDALRVAVYRTRAEMGAAAAADVASALRALLAAQQDVRVVFAAAPSQNEMLDGLAVAPGIDWSRVTALHMDEYVDLPAGAPQLFQTYLAEHLWDRVRPGRIHRIGVGGDPDATARAYAQVLAEAPVDIVCLGIGENGHIAFNDPPVADFEDPVSVKIVALDEVCRKQQVHDGCFATLDAVPRRALTLTLPALMAGRRLFCVVPGPAKRPAVERTLSGRIATDCPATILRRHADCRLYLDVDSAGEAARGRQPGMITG